MNGYTNGTIITTGVDSLLNLVNDHTEISLTEAAQQLKIARSTVGEWSRTLEEAGLVTSRVTLLDRHLMSKDSKSLRGIRSYVGPQAALSRFFGTSKNPGEIELKKKEEEIKSHLKRLDDKIKQFEGLKQLKAELAKQEHTLKQEHKRLDAEKSAIAEKLKAELAKQEHTLKQEQKRLAEENSALAERLKAQFAKQGHALKQEKKRLAEENSALAEKGKSLLQEKAAVAAMTKKVAEEQASVGAFDRQLQMREDHLHESEKSLAHRERMFHNLVARIAKLAK